MKAKAIGVVFPGPAPSPAHYIVGGGWLQVEFGQVMGVLLTHILGEFRVQTMIYCLGLILLRFLSTKLLS